MGSKKAKAQKKKVKVQKVIGLKMVEKMLELMGLAHVDHPDGPG
jgi:hypothetical protein